MRIYLFISLVTLLVFGVGCASLPSGEGPDDVALSNTGNDSDLEAFPVAEAGYQRHVFRLPELEDESSHMVTLVIGKRVLTDTVNNYRILGSLEPVTVEGWGYTYYQLESQGQMMGTLMAVHPSAPKLERFIEVNTQMQPIRYNSKLPVVVIVPDGFDVKYRVWTAGDLQAAPQG
ncbi:ecotin family protein [Coraliomargarita sp. SDUM461004]|uniref:Ecotin family protein n=1 Tax=Thalassobacterium sedimentorum TaxID=3041258 RepID=A0ABU1AHD0_9BACT|nr:ecotin family protein [Coraliomargarita sp. SDUM461004]MDQ8194232.1 ecotin family protein [Coraliomargarita sp. SDUM461004]